jgi:hypothetical protein
MPNFSSGGPELLHQLAHKLRIKGINAFMYYSPSDHPSPIHPNYSEYGIPFVRDIEDSERHVIIAPELYTTFLKEFNSIKQAIWWLSIDFYYLNSFGKFKIIRILNNLILHQFNRQRYISFDRGLQNIPYHLTQSAYAKKHLEGKGISRTLSLGDYLHRAFLNIKTDISTKQKKVTYNPGKGV